MRHNKRRQKAGEMLMDVSKYLLTIGLISGIITNKTSVSTAIVIFIAVIVFFVLAFFIIPPEKDK